MMCGTGIPETKWTVDGCGRKLAGRGPIWWSIAFVCLACSGAAGPLWAQDYPTYTGNVPPVAGSSGSLELNDNLAGDTTFRWQSTDAILGAIDTGRVAAAVWNLTAGPPNRLVFQGVAGNVTIAGDMLFDEFEKGVVDVTVDDPIDGQKHLRYLVVRADLAFIETDEDANNGEDLLRMFNPHPIVTLDPTPNPGNAESVNIMVKGEVKDFIAPVETVLVNGQTANVTQTDSGDGGLGPFEGTFEIQVGLTGHNTLIEVHAINSLKNIGKDSVLITVTRDANFTITSRTVTEQESVPAAPADDQALYDFHEFKIELNARDIAGNTANVSFNTGVETKNVEVTRQGSSNRFLSKDLLLCPKNLMLAAGAAQVIKDTRFKGDFGVEAEISITVPAGLLEDTGIPIGMLLLKKTDGSIADFVDSGIEADVTNATAARSYEIRVGLPGETNGAQIVVDLQGVDHEWADLTQPQPAASFPPVMKTLTLDRVGSDSSMPDYNLYVTDSSKPLMGVRSKLPQDASCNPQDNASLEELYSEFDGGIKLTRSADSIELIEPMIGIEVVAEQPGMANTFKAAGVIPNGNPAPPIVSVGDGAPRPQVVINANAANTMYVGTAGNPTRIQVQGTITDPLADLIDGNTLAAVGLSFQINGTNQAVTINRPANDPPRPFQATFNVNIDLTALAQAQDSLAILNRPTPLVNNRALLLAQQAIIARVGNGVGNVGFDSVFWKIVDPNGDLMFDGGANAHTARPAHWPHTVNTTPPRFFVLFHNPFKTEVMFNQQLNSKKGDGTQLFTKNIEIKRKIWGNSHRYGPFLAGTVDRTNAAPPAIADSVPFLAMIKFNRNAQGQITGREIAETMEATAPAPSRDDTTDCPALDLRINDTDAGKDTFLPTGTDAAPTGVNLVAQITPACLATNRNVIFQLVNVTNFLGHCNNAPRPGTPNLSRHDFSFTPGADNVGPTAAINFNGMGKATTTLHSKDNGGRVTLQAQLNLPGNPTVLMDIPQDKDGDFLPDVWEARFAGAGGANANDPVRDGVEDIEDRNLTGGAVVHNEMGDGYTALEEYRGFSVTPAAGGPAVVTRMDQIARAWGIAVTGTVANGNLVAGPRVKDVLIHLNLNTGTDGMGTAAPNTTIPIAFPAVPTYPTIFPIAFHLVQPADFTNNLAAANLSHDHDMNWNGDNDGFNAAADRQKALHVRDARFGCPQILGGAQSFVPDNNDLNINSDNNAAGNPVNGAQAGFAAATLNDVTIFHEIGHIFGLRHPFGTVSNGAAAFGPAVILAAAAAQDFDGDGNNDFNGTDGLPNGVAPFMVPPTAADGTAEGFVDAPANNYLDNTGGTRRSLGNPLREVLEGNTVWTGYLRVGGANRNNPTQVGSRTTGVFGPGLQFVTSVWFPNQQVAAGGFNNLIRGTIFGPTMMDWVVFLAPNAPVLERNLNAIQILLTGQNFQSPPGTNIMHANELRVKTHP